MTADARTTSRGLSLTTRVALASALAASLGGAVAAVASGVTARGLIHAHQKHTLLKAAEDLASEMREEFEEEDDEETARDYGGPEGRTFGAVLAHELEDVKLPAARAVLVEDGRVIAGDASLARPPVGECVNTTLGSRPQRACSVRFGERTVTLAASEEREREQLGLFGRAIFFGALVGAVLGWLLSRRVADWVLKPLHELRDRVRAVQVDRASGPDAPRGLALETPSPGEVEELRLAIAQLVERLGAALGQARAFAAEAAHELRTPLTTIAGELELLAEREPLDGRASLSRVRAQVADLGSLVERLLTLARTVDLRPAQTEVVDLSDVLTMVLSGLGPELRARVRAQAADDVIVRGDSALLRVLLANAVDNALKFSSEGVEIDVTPQAGEAVIDVKDAGSGVAEVDRALVFTPFFRTRTARASGVAGHGMGLALIAAVAQAHGGHAEFLPVARGTQLQVRLPLWSPREPRPKCGGDNT